MAQIDLPYLCTTIGNLSGVPVRIFEGESMTFYYSQAYLPRDPMAVYREKIFAVRSHVGYLTTPPLSLLRHRQLRRHEDRHRPNPSGGGE